jgi:hypothetical protein
MLTFKNYPAIQPTGPYFSSKRPADAGLFLEIKALLPAKEEQKQKI